MSTFFFSETGVQRKPKNTSLSIINMEEKRIIETTQVVIKNFYELRTLKT